jgi:hypothetical protein
MWWWFFVLNGVAALPCPGPCPDIVCGPSFFVIGTFKAGTTSLYQYLGHHSQVRYVDPGQLTAVQLKEVGFFLAFNQTGYLNGQSFVRDRERIAPMRIQPGRLRLETVRQYVTTYFPVRVPRKEWLTGEASPGYFTSLNAMRYIHHHFPRARLILSVREPTERVWSRVRHLVQLFCTGRHTSGSLNDVWNDRSNRSWGFDCDNIQETAGRSLELLVQKTLPLFESCLREAEQQLPTHDWLRIGRELVSCWQNIARPHRRLVFQQTLHGHRSQSEDGPQEASRLWASLVRVSLWLNSTLYLWIMAWLQFFPREQLLVIHAQDLFRDVPQTMNRVTRHLHLPDHDWQSLAQVRYNVMWVNQTRGGIQRQFMRSPAFHLHSSSWALAIHRVFNSTSERLFQWAGERWW